MEQLKKIKVLIVDDSAVVRNVLSVELAKDPQIEVVGVAADPYIARDKIVFLQPDVVTLDVEMPRMDGVTFLEKLMEYYPIPVVILSSLTPAGCDLALRALELGAIDVIHKPSLDISYKLNEMMTVLIDKIKTAHQYRFRFRVKSKDFEAKAVKEPQEIKMIGTTDKIVAIGASTGGTEALRVIIPALPASFPGIVVTQHMPEHFTKAFAQHLADISKMEVREAKDQDTVHTGLVLIARGNYHMLLRRSGARYYVEVKQGPLVCRQCPSVEVLFNSVAKYAGQNATGVILTGMGNDGAQGMLTMKHAGAFTIAQDEKSCVVYGMPKEAVKLGAVDRILPLEDIPAALMRRFAAV